MSKTKRKIIKKVTTINLKDKEKEFFYSRGVQDALHTVLTQHKDLIQLKDLCLEYEKLFKYPHPTREWHINRKVTGASSLDESNGTTANATDNNANQPTQDVKEIQLPEQETNQVTTGEETTS